MSENLFHCENCFHRLPADAGYCPRCGHPVERAIPQETSEPTTDQFEPPLRGLPSWHLMLVRPDGEQLSFSMSERLTIGRSPDNDLQLQDTQVSRMHALIEMGPNGYLLSDLGSSNGTYLNRKRVHMPVKLRVGDAISIGQHRLLVQRSTLNCGNCARPVLSGDIFCKHCGEPLSGVPGSLKPGGPFPEGTGHSTDPLDEPVQTPVRGLDLQEMPEVLSPAASTRSEAAAPVLRPVRPPRPTVRPSSPVRTPAAPPPAPKPPKITPQPADVRPAESARNWLQTCAVLAVVGLCLAATLGAFGYWYLVTYLLPLN